MAGDVLCPSTGTAVQLYNKAGLTVLLKHMSFLSKSQLTSHFLNWVSFIYSRLGDTALQDRHQSQLHHLVTTNHVWISGGNSKVKTAEGMVYLFCPTVSQAVPATFQSSGLPGQNSPLCELTQAQAAGTAIGPSSEYLVEMVFPDLLSAPELS